jgi:hypothetical protein
VGQVLDIFTQTFEERLGFGILQEGLISEGKASLYHAI